MSDSLRPHELQHTRPPCPSLSPGVCSNSCPLSQWCHPTVSSSIAFFSFCLQPFPCSGSFPMCQLFASGGRSIRASASVLPVNIWGWFPLEYTLLFVKHIANGNLLYDAGNPKPVLCDNLEGWIGWEVGGRFKEEGTYVYQWLIQADIWHKPSQYCKLIIL